MLNGQAIRFVVPTMVAAALLAVSVSQNSKAETRQPKSAAARQTARDWSGVWLPSGTPTVHSLGLGGAIVDPDGAAKLEDNRGRTPYELRQPIPYNAEYQAQYEKILKDIRTSGYNYDHSAECLPLGMPRLMIIATPMEFFIEAKRVIMRFETSSAARWVYTDGRKHSEPDDLDLGYSGESIGHWEGDTLVVDTTGIRDDVTFDFTGARHSDALHIVERIRRLDEKTIEDRMVIEDAKALTKPWVVVRRLEHHPEQEMKEYVCTNNRKFPQPSAATVR